MPANGRRDLIRRLRLKRLKSISPFHVDVRTILSLGVAFLTGYSKTGNSVFKLHFLAPLQLQNRRIILAFLRFADGLMLTTDTILEQKRLIQNEEEQRGRSAAQSKSKVS